ncbi:hypothetical protein D3C72_1699720 [compost metagenome]
MGERLGSDGVEQPALRAVGHVVLVPVPHDLELGGEYRLERMDLACAVADRNQQGVIPYGANLAGIFVDLLPLAHAQAVRLHALGFQIGVVVGSFW